MSVWASYAGCPKPMSFNFAPRFQVPTLMGGGRSDFVFPLETSIRPMFRLLGAPDKDKRLVLRDGGHGDVGPGMRETIKDALEWFDQYLGPVKRD